MVPKFLNYINHDIWRVQSRKTQGSKGRLIHYLRVFILSFREFASDQCTLRASALTFYSLLSIVPVFAMAFGIAKGFDMDKILQEKLMENMQGQQEVMSRILEFSQNMLVNTKGGVVAGVGLALLFWTVIQVLSNIEIAFNNIWGIKKNRTLGQKFADYLALMLIAPVFFIIASSSTVFIASQVRLITEKIVILGAFGPFIFALMKLFPVVIFAGLLTYLYIFMPNGKIQWKSALLGGIVAGVVYHLVQWVYVYFQIGASNAGAVYGTFAALPLFLAWLQTSWLIVLYGAELAYAHQNEKDFEFAAESREACASLKKLVALRLTQVCVGRFVAGQPALCDEELAEELGVPIRLVRNVLDQLVAAKILSLVQSDNERERYYQPGRDVSEMTISFVLCHLGKVGSEDVPINETPEIEKIRKSLDSFERQIENSADNFLLKDLSTATSKQR